MGKFSFTSNFDCSQEQLFRWHERKGILERLTPQWENVTIIKRTESIQIGATGIFCINQKLLGRINWHALHTEYLPFSTFQDIQTKGPFKKWIHTHKIDSKEDQTSSLTDYIEFELPLSPISNPTERFVMKKLKKMFTYRHNITKNDILFLQHQHITPLRIAVTGSTGLIGSNLIPLLESHGHKIIKVIRDKTKKLDTNEIYWNPYEKIIDGDLEGIDGIIHLSGAPIGEGRWNDKSKSLYVDSRIEPTIFLVTLLQKMRTKPKFFITASAIGYYGDRCDIMMDESSVQGEGFLADLCNKWELNANINDNITRSVFLRIGITLSLKGGALQKLYTYTKNHLGAYIGSGNQFLSWISLDDLLYSICHTVYNENISGAVNIVSPNPLTQREFIDTLAETLNRKVHLRLTDAWINRIFGEMGQEILLSSCRAVPKKLLDNGFTFTHSSLKNAFEHLLGIDNE